MNKVLLIYTGGTIGMGKNPLTGALEPLDFNHLVDSMPEFKLIKADIDVYQFSAPIDSSDMAPAQWAQLVRIVSTDVYKRQMVTCWPTTPRFSSPSRR